MISANMTAILASYAPSVESWVEIGLIKRGIDGGVTQTSTFRAASQVGLYLGAGQYFSYPWLEGARLKREAQDLVSGQGGGDLVTLNNGGTLTFPNHNMELDTIFGRGGWSVLGQPVTIGVTATVNPYVGLSVPGASAILFRGVATGLSVTDSEVSITIEDDLHLLEITKIATTQLTTAEYPNLDETLEGKTKKVILGHAFGVELDEVDRLDQGGKFIVAGHHCQASASTVFRRDGLAMVEGVDYTEALSHSDGNAYITLINARLGARITGDIQGITMPHLGVYSAKLTEIDLYLMSLAGFQVGYFNAAGLARARALHNWDVGLVVDTETSIKDVWEQLNAGVPKILDQRGQNSFYLAPYEEPSGTADITTDETNILEHTMEDAPQYRGIRLTYAPYETTFSTAEMAGVIPETDPALAERLGQDTLSYSVDVTGADASLDVLTYDTRLRNLVDVQALAQINLDLFGRRHVDHIIRIGAVGAAINGIGSVITTQRDRYSLAEDNITLRILSMTEDWNTGGPDVEIRGRRLAA